MNRLWNLSLITIVLSCWVSAAVALPIQCEPSNERVAILDSATQCKTGLGNLNDPDQVHDFFGGTWTKEGEITASGSSVGSLLTISFTSGSWGGQNVAGTWNIDSSFWTEYGMAVITMHVGNGNGNPDHFAWMIDKNNPLSGTFSYRDVDMTGGGLSNFFLFGSGVPTTTTNIPLPESGVGMLMLIGFASVLLARRRV